MLSHILDLTVYARKIRLTGFIDEIKLKHFSQKHCSSRLKKSILQLPTNIISVDTHTNTQPNTVFCNAIS